MEKNVVRLNESQLRGLIKESVKRVVNEDMFYSGKGLAGEDIIRANPITFRNIMNSIRNGEYDNMIAENLDAILGGDYNWFENHIDIVAQNIDVASDLYMDIKYALIERAKGSKHSNTVKLNEQDLHKIIKETVKKVLNEEANAEDGIKGWF